MLTYADKIDTIAIDIGASNTLISYWENNNVNIIPNELGDNYTPTYVTFIQENEIEIGTSAQQKSNIKYVSSIYDIKNLIGKKLNDIKNKEKYNFPLLEDDKGKLKVQIEIKDTKKLQKIDDKVFGAFSTKVKIQTIKFQYYPEEVLGKFLKKLLENAENYLNSKIKNVICSIPDCFGDEQRNSLKKVIESVELKLLEIINESTAASLSYGIENFNINEKFIVFDIGGGKTEITLLTIDNEKKIKVLNKIADLELGGVNFTNKIYEKLKTDFEKKNDVDISKNAQVKLMKEAENIKIKLSDKNSVDINFEKFFLGNDLVYKFTLDEFENISNDLFEKIKKLIFDLLNPKENYEKVSNNEIKKIILIGLASKMKKIKTILINTFPNAKILDNKIDAVVIGTAIRGAIIENKIQDKSKKVEFKDVTPLSLGTRTSGGRFSRLIPKNTEIPTKEIYYKDYRSTKDNTTHFKIQVYEGEQEFVKDNNLITEFLVEGFEPKPKGEVKMRVTFSVDENSILQIKAEDLSNPNHVVNKAIINNQVVNYDKINLLKDSKSNFKYNISKYKKLREENKNNPQKYFENQKELCKVYEELIKSFNLNEVQTNQTLVEKLEIYVKLLFQEYSILFEYQNFITENEINHIKNIIYTNLKFLISYQNIDVYSIIELLNSNKNIYEFCKIFIFEDLYTKAQINFEENNLKKSKEKFNKALNTYNNNNLVYIINSLDKSKSNYYNQILSNIKTKLNCIKIKEKIEEAYQYKKEAIRNGYLFDANKLQRTIDVFNEANNINTNDGEDPPIDKNSHILCCKEINNLLLNKFGNDDEDIKNFVKEAGNVLETFHVKINNLNNNMSDEEFSRQFKNSNSGIIQEMNNILKNNNFNKKCLDFIKLILKKYPPLKPFDKNFNIEKEFEKDPKNVLKKLKVKYNPTNYSKESVEKKAKYLIVQEIAGMLNGIYTEL
jgi:molecular chaperone DnaK (HSP70)